jgi:hypothetical protein
MGAQMEEEGRFYAIANLRSFLGGDEFAQRAQSMDYSGEDSVCAPRCPLVSAELARVTAHGEVIDAKFCTNR